MILSSEIVTLYMYSNVGLTIYHSKLSNNKTKLYGEI